MCTLLITLFVASVPAEASDLTLSIGARAESFYSYSFNTPDNGDNYYRLFDNRHTSIGLSAAAAHLQADFHGAQARDTRRVRSTPVNLPRTIHLVLAMPVFGDCLRRPMRATALI